MRAWEDNLPPPMGSQEGNKREGWTRDSSQILGSRPSVQDLMSSQQVRSASGSQLASPAGPYLSRLLAGPFRRGTRLKGGWVGRMALEVPDSSGSLHTESLEECEVLSLQKSRRTFPCDGDTNHSFLHNHPRCSPGWRQTACCAWALFSNPSCFFFISL